jgi:predicted nuclease with TOPRIM domain
MEQSYKDTKQKIIKLWDKINELILLEEELFKRIEEAEARLTVINQKLNANQ